MKVRRLFLCFVSGLFTASLLWSTTTLALTQQTKLIPENGEPNDQFGSSVSISGGHALIGAYFDDDLGKNSGSAYIFYLQSDGTWDQKVKLTADDGSLEDFFGYSVSISGDYALVGAYYNDANGMDDSGGAYVFELANGKWSQMPKLIPDDGKASDEFGSSVSISGKYAVVGAKSGAYVFELANGKWSQMPKLIPDDGKASDEFGSSVSISGKYAVVGAKASAYAFELLADGTWSQMPKLIPDGGKASDEFGSSVSISGKYVVVGAKGSAYVFELANGTWSQATKLISTDGKASDGFGSSVSASANYVVVGDKDNNNVKGLFSGGAYVFEPQAPFTWKEIAFLTADDGKPGDHFGGSVSISDDFALMGAAMHDEEGGSNSGAAYVAKLIPGPVISVDPFSLDFGKIPATTSEQAIIEVSNEGSAELEIYKISVMGVDAGIFEVEPKAMKIGEGNSGKVTVTFKPTSGGKKDATLILTHNAGDSLLEIMLTGHCLGVPAPGEFKLTADDGEEDDRFGYSVSLSGGYALVGAPDDNDNESEFGVEAGSAYVYEQHPSGMWEKEVKLLPSDGSGGDHFGFSVSLHDNLALIGVPGDNDNGNDSGSAYVFQPAEYDISNMSLEDISNMAWAANPDMFDPVEPFSKGLPTPFSNKVLPTPGKNWIEMAKLTAKKGEKDDGFGWSVSLYGDYALVGSPMDDDKGFGSGSAYVFQLQSDGTWDQTAKLTADDGDAQDWFGYFVSLYGDHAIVGMPRDDDNEDDSGSAYVFQRTGQDWSPVAKLVANDADASDQFGWSVSLYGNYALVGAYRDDEKGLASGSSYHFERQANGTWKQLLKLTSFDAFKEDWFGHSVSLSSDYALVGAIFDDDKGDGSGSAYVYYVNTNPAISVAPASLNFGSISPLTSKKASIQVSNEGIPTGNTLKVNEISVTGVDSSMFEIEPEAMNIGVGGSKDVTVTFTPESLGSKNAELKLEHNAEGTPLVIPLSGTGGVPPGQDVLNQIKLTAWNGTGDDGFGHSVSIDGDYAIVGAPFGDDHSAHIFKRTGEIWTEQELVFVSELAKKKGFGWSVSIDGDYAIVGAPYDNDVWDVGSAYIFKRTGEIWTEQAKLKTPSSHLFGWSVSIDGDYALVGDPYGGNSGTASNSGLSYVFQRTGQEWNQVAKLIAKDFGQKDRFGWSVSLYDGYALIGAREDDSKGENSGSAYVFQLQSDGTWDQTKLTADDGDAQDRFGMSVSISGDYALVGAPYDDDYLSGSAYVFQLQPDGTWDQTAKLTADDATTGDVFGQSVSIDGDYAIVGAHGDDDSGTESGSAYMFKRDGTVWTQQPKLTAFDGATDDWFGYSVSLSGDCAIVGAYFDDDKGLNSGSAYLFCSFGEASTIFQPSSLDFGDVPAGSFKDAEFTITNPGNDPLIILDITVTSDVFTIIPEVTPRILSDIPVVPRYASINRTVRFAPTTGNTSSAFVVITSNAPSSPDTIFVWGVGAITETSVPRRGLAVYGHMGYGELALGDLNADIGAEEEVLFREHGIPVNLKRFGRELDFGFGFSYRVSNVVGLGLDLSAQSATIDNRVSVSDISIPDAIDINITDVTGFVELWLPAARGFHLGAMGGMGFGRFHEYLQSAALGSVNSREEYKFSGSGFTMGAFAGFRVPVGTKVQLFVRGGYRYRNLGVFDGSTDRPWHPREFDYSGVFFRTVLGINVR